MGLGTYPEWSRMLMDVSRFDHVGEICNRLSNMVTGVDGGRHDPFALCYLSLSCECAYCTEMV